MFVPPEQGAVFFNIGSVPAAGTNFDYVVPASTRILLLGLSFTFATDANVSNRLISIDIEDGSANRVLSSLQLAAMTASNIYQVFFAAYPQEEAYAISTELIRLGVFSPVLPLRSLWHIKSRCDGIQATDQFDNIYALAYQWIDPVV